MLHIRGRKISFSVGLSNILDGELGRRKPVKGSHREVVGAAVVDGKLLCEVIQGKESVRRIEALLILAVAALHFAVVTRCIGANQLVADTQLGGSRLKDCLLYTSPSPRDKRQSRMPSSA